MANIFLTHVVDVEPKNWTELANAAKLLEGNYAGFVTSGAIVVAGCLSSPQVGSQQLIQMQKGLSNIKTYTELLGQASQVRLGAMAANKENIFGNWKDKGQIAMRVVDALRRGSIIMNFVESARTLSLNGILAKDDTHPYVVNSNDLASQGMFDQAIKIIKAFQGSLPHSDTVVELVREEIGILPDHVRQTILDVMALKPSVLES